MASKTSSRKPKDNETALVKACLELLKLRGVFAWRNQTMGTFDPVKNIYRKFLGLAGVSDILGILNRGCHNGQFFACEVKMPGKKPTPEQQEFLRLVIQNGGVGIWVSSVMELDVALAQRGI